MCCVWLQGFVLGEANQHCSTRNYRHISCVDDVEPASPLPERKRREGLILMYNLVDAETFEPAYMWKKFSAAGMCMIHERADIYPITRE